MTPAAGCACRRAAEVVSVAGAMVRKRLALAPEELRRRLDPASLPINADLGFYYCNAARQYDQGIEQMKKTLELEPDWPRAHFLLGYCYSQKGMYDEALREMRQTTGPVAIAIVYARTGRRDEALKTLAEMKERSKREYVAPLAIANLYLAIEAGLEIIDALAGVPALRGYHLLPSARGDLLAQLGRTVEARTEFARAAELTRNERERALLLERAQSLG